MYTLNSLAECWICLVCFTLLLVLWGTEQLNRRLHRQNFRTIDKCWFAGAMHWSISYRWFWVSLYIDVRFLSPIHSVRNKIKPQRLFRMIKKILCALHCCVHQTQSTTCLSMIFCCFGHCCRAYHISIFSIYADVTCTYKEGESAWIENW